MKDMINRTALPSLVMIPDLRNEIVPTVPSNFIWSDLPAEAFVDCDNINFFIYFFQHTQSFQDRPV